MYEILAYIKFLFKSTNQHGVHSPFVFNFVTKCLYAKEIYEPYKKIKAYRNDLLNNLDTIDINDFGSGSRVFKSNQRSIKAIVKNSGTPYSRAKLLFRMSKYFEPKKTLELGTSLGIATYAMAIGHPKNKVISIEGCPNISNYARQALNAFEIDNVNVITGTFENILPKLKEDYFDLIFFDGHHNKEATIHYFETLIPKAHNDTVFIFDDIYWSKGMQEAWKFIKAHEAVTVTIDCFYLGFVFFRKEQQKEHFQIRM